jgi:GMP synthase-like glutamine amidotransferase
MPHAAQETMRLRCLQHVPFEGPEEIAHWAGERGHTLGITKLFRDEPLPDAGEFDSLIVMGGPMSVHDEHLYPWLAGEKSLIARCLQERRFVLGICLGSQLLAEGLGTRVYRNAFKEIGWLPVRLRAGAAAGSLLEGLSAELTVLHPPSQWGSHW